MKNLWECLPPMRADSFGFREIVTQTEGYGLIDDSSNYHGGEAGGGHRGARRLPFCASELRSEDAVSGSANLLLEEAREIAAYHHPAFLLIGSGPAASMVGTDLQDTARRIEQELGLKTQEVDINGHRSYDHGVAKTLEAVAKLTARPAEARKGTVGLIGGSSLDIGSGNLDAVEQWCRENGFEPIRTDRSFARAAEASVNLVLTCSGLDAAKWLKEQFGTEYVCALPFGGAWSRSVAEQLRGGGEPETGGGGEKSALILGEQFISNALRNTLRWEYGYGKVDVCSFFNMDKALMEPGDKKLRYEDDLTARLEGSSYDTIIADGIYRACGGRNAKWISLPCKAFLVPTAPMPELVGEELNGWLDKELKE